jgi:hypothetical protein
VESGLHNGALRMYQALMDSRFEVGPLTAAKAEALYVEEFQSGHKPSWNTEEHFILGATLQGVLGRCGASGLAALRRMGTLTTPEGIEALRYMNTPEAEEVLLEMLEDPTSHPLTKLDVMRVLNHYQYTDPKPERLARYREPLVGILVVPTDDWQYDLQTLEKAVRMAMSTGDPYYREAILALERSLDPAALEKADRADTEGLDPTQFPKKYDSASLLHAINSAKNVLR